VKNPTSIALLSKFL